jgi:hypothetical protein
MNQTQILIAKRDLWVVRYQNVLNRMQAKFQRELLAETRSEAEFNKMERKHFRRVMRVVNNLNKRIVDIDAELEAIAA